MIFSPTSSITHQCVLEGLTNPGKSVEGAGHEGQPEPYSGFDVPGETTAARCGTSAQPPVGIPHSSDSDPLCAAQQCQQPQGRKEGLVAGCRDATDGPRHDHPSPFRAVLLLYYILGRGSIATATGDP
jgi:hypothetical protein